MREIDFPFEGRKTIDALVHRLHKEPPYLYQGVPIIDRREEFDVLNYFTPDVMRAKYMELAQGDGVKISQSNTSALHFDNSYRGALVEVTQGGVLLTSYTIYSHPGGRQEVFPPMETIGLYGIGQDESDADFAFGIEVTPYKTDEGPVNLYQIKEGSKGFPDNFPGDITRIAPLSTNFVSRKIFVGTPDWGEKQQRTLAQNLGLKLPGK